MLVRKLGSVGYLNEYCSSLILPFFFFFFKYLFVCVEVALLSELEFKHQVTTARGEGGRRGRGA